MSAVVELFPLRRIGSSKLLWIVFLELWRRGAWRHQYNYLGIKSKVDVFVLKKNVLYI